MTAGRIVVCEPQCRGFEHALFNAALLQTVLLAYPEAPVTFLGEGEHLGWVRQSLERARGTEARAIEWRETEVPPAPLRAWERDWERFRFERPAFRRMAAVAREPGVALVMFSSITNSGVLALQLALRRRPPRAAVLVIPHGILKTVLWGLPAPWRERLIHLKLLLLLPQPRRLRYIALGGSIHQALHQALPRAARPFRVLDHPYFWEQDGAAPLPPAGETPARFGFFGVGTKGFDLFARLAADTRRRVPHAEFVMVGFVTDPEQCQAAAAVAGVSDTPLAPDEYRRRAAGLTYAVWTAYREDYRAAASASFLDALSYVKPGIYLRNPYVAHYFERMGDIGYLCDSPEEMLEVIASLAEDFPAERYARQCRNILAGRRLFEPAVLALELRSIVDDCRR